MSTEVRADVRVAPRDQPASSTGTRGNPNWQPGVSGNPRGNPRWLPGISGNPGGRSRELAQQQGAARLKAAGHADEAIDYLLKVLRSEDEGTAHRLKAAIELLNRGLGLPQTQIDVDVTVRRKINEMTIEELRQLEDRLAGSLTSAVPLLLESQLVKPPDGSDG